MPQMADGFVNRNWPPIVSAFVRQVNPLMESLLSKMNNSWVTLQVEYATDVMFTSSAALEGLYERCRPQTRKMPPRPARGRH